MGDLDLFVSVVMMFGFITYLVVADAILHIAIATKCKITDYEIFGDEKSCRN